MTSLAIRLPAEEGARWIRTKSGIVIDAAADQWSYKDGLHRVHVDFTRLSELSPVLVDGVRQTLIWYVENRAPGTVTTTFYYLNHFLRHAVKPGEQLQSISASDLLNYRARLKPEADSFLGRLGGFVKKWHRLGYPGVDLDSISLLRQLRLKAPVKGVAVLTMDPNKGPFTNIEAEALQDALNAEYAAGEVDTEDYVLAWLFILLGQRSKQYAAMKVCDVHVKADAQGVLTYSVSMPSVKKRKASPRDRMRERPIIEQFGELLVEHARRVQQEFEGRTEAADKAPLFPARRRQTEAPGFEFHRTPGSISARLVTVLQRLRVNSERTGKPMKLLSRRFRSSIGTRAAENGCGELVIAGLLDHEDTQHVRVYSANSPLIIERIDRAIAMDMAPLAQAFAGVIIDAKSGAKDPNQRIIDLRIDRSGNPMGECGSHGFCGFSAPIACYTCQSFEAWLNGPHEAVLDYLIKRRERLLATSDKRMASINDRSILAVAAVVQRCAELMSEAKGRALG